LHKDAPIFRPIQRIGIICSHPILGGRHHHYVRFEFSVHTGTALHPQFRLLGRRIWDLGPARQLFWIESERRKLSAPFSRRIAESLDADAAGQGIALSNIKFNGVGGLRTYLSLTHSGSSES
jgi:hypothetical protein